MYNTLLTLTFRSLSYSIFFQSLDVVCRYRDTQPQVTEKLCYLGILIHNIYISVSRLRHILLLTGYQGLYRS